MKVLNIDAGKSINANTGECWYKANLHVSIDENENPETVFKELKERLDGWLPNPFAEVVFTPVVKKETIEDLKKEFNASTK